MLNVVYDSFPHKNNHYVYFRKEFLYDTFLTLFVLSRASDNTRPTSQNIGGTDAWAVPHLKFLGGPFPSPPRSPPLENHEVIWVITVYSLT